MVAGNLPPDGPAADINYVVGGGGGGPAFPTVNGFSHGGSSVGGATQLMTLPTGIVVGELLLAIALFNEDGGGGLPTWQAGWTGLGAVQTGGFENCYGMVGYRVATGSEGTTVSLTGPDGAARAVWQIYRLGSFMNIPVVAFASGGFSTNMDPPNLVSGFGNVETLWLPACFMASSTPVSGYPANYTNTQQDNASGTNAGMGGCRRALKAASEDPGLFTNVAGPRWATLTVAVRGAGT